QPIFRAGLNYKIAEGTNVRASFGQAFRVPSVAERFANTSGGGILVEPNPSIQSERGYSAEFALRQGFRSEGAKWGIKGYLDLAAFMMQFDNMVEFGIKTRRIAFPQLDIRFSSINVADARILGSELTGMLIAESRDKKTFASFSGGVTWIEPTDLNAVPDSLQLDLVQFPSDIVNQDKTDQPPFLKYRSRWTIRGSASLGYHGLSLTANYRYKSFVQNIDQYLFLVIDDLADFRSRYPNGDHVMDFILAWEFDRRQTVSLTLDNAFNREYLIIPGLLAPQRKFTLQYQVRF
ncbi:MAG: TonB-dependent receptor, partial [Bacteroidetes bacterium]